ncbi:MAG: hypothetical protein HRT58_10540 [Crocinitomicaceae bacterium]|nr:hypothetical protein [Flavobacteriales bacterium]NQZ36091.1 hypothetical protein [Crocinitomicaceae bacterium]
MIRLKGILLITFGLFTLGAFAQDCDGVVRECQRLLTKGDFISDGQVYTAFLDRERAEFKTTLYGGTTYRIAASAGTKDDFVLFSIKDPEGHTLFSNRNYKNAPYWDFRVEETIPVVIETELDLDLKTSGCVVMMIGFKR